MVHRGVRPDLLERARADPATASLAWCNPLTATLDVGDRATLQARPEGAGVPTPSASPRATWWAVVEHHGAPCVVKRAEGRAGRAAGVPIEPTGPLPEAPPFDSPYLVQALVPDDGLDRTLYVAGERTFLALKRVDVERSRSDLVAVAAPDARLCGLARRVGEATGLELFGLDAIEGPDGPVVVDVNAFPGFRGVPGAADAIARHLWRRAAAVAAEGGRRLPSS